MIHAVSLLVCLAAFAALALATDRVQHDVLGRPLSTVASARLRAIGSLLLIASLAYIVTAQGWSLGLVSYSGHTSLSAGVVFLGLIAWQRRRHRAPRR